MQEAVEPSVVVVVGEQQVARPGVGAFALGDGQVSTPSGYTRNSVTVSKFSPFSIEVIRCPPGAPAGDGARSCPGAADSPGPPGRRCHSGSSRATTALDGAHRTEIDRAGPLDREPVAASRPRRGSERGWRHTGKPSLVEVEPHRIRLVEMLNPVQCPRERPHASRWHLRAGARGGRGGLRGELPLHVAAAGQPGLRPHGGASGNRAAVPGLRGTLLVRPHRAGGPGGRLHRPVHRV